MRATLALYGLSSTLEKIRFTRKLFHFPFLLHEIFLILRRKNQTIILKKKIKLWDTNEISENVKARRE